MAEGMEKRYDCKIQTLGPTEGGDMQVKVHNRSHLAAEEVINSGHI